MQTTPLEALGIKGIMESEYNNSAPNESLPIWSWAIDTLTERQRPGVVSSLVKKGLAVSRGIPAEREVFLTKAGVQIYRALFQKSDYALLAEEIMNPTKPCVVSDVYETQAKALSELLQAMLATEEGAGYATEVLNQFPLQLVLRTKTVRLLPHTVKG